MRTARFYQAESLEVGQTLVLSAQNFRHAIQVLRLKPPSKLILFNGQGGEYTATISEAGKKSASVCVTSYDPVKRELSRTLQLVLALIKPDRLDFALQKAVELGVSSIQLVTTERSIVQIKSSRLEKKLRHWESVIISACEQSGRTHLPQLLAPVSLHHYLQTPTNALRLVMLPNASASPKQLTLKKTAIELFIGPEGGYTETEENLFKEYNIQAFTFGSRILRAETAVIAGLAVIQMQ